MGDNPHHDPRHTSMGRPAGQIRQALVGAMLDSPGTLRQLAQRSGVGYDATRSTLGNMARAGVVIAVDQVDTGTRSSLVKVHALGCALPQPGDLPRDALHHSDRSNVVHALFVDWDVT